MDLLGDPGKMTQGNLFIERKVSGQLNRLAPSLFRGILAQRKVITSAGANCEKASLHTDFTTLQEKSREKENFSFDFSCTVLKSVRRLRKG